MTPERQNELQSQIDKKFDQFSLDEVHAAGTGAITLRTEFPELSVREREFAEDYFNLKVIELRRQVPDEQ